MHIILFFVFYLTSKELFHEDTVIVLLLCKRESLSVVTLEGGRKTLLGFVFEVIKAIRQDDSILHRVDSALSS